MASLRERLLPLLKRPTGAVGVHAGSQTVMAQTGTRFNPIGYRRIGFPSTGIVKKIRITMVNVGLVVREGRYRVWIITTRSQVLPLVEILVGHCSIIAISG